MSVKTMLKYTFLSLALLLLVAGSVVIPAVPVKAGASPAYIGITSSPYSILANGISTSTITVTVTDADHNPVVACTVTLSTDHGVLDDTTPETDVDGNATATLTSEASATTVIATIKVVVNALKEATAVFFLPPGNPGISEMGTMLITGNGVASYVWYGSVTLEATGDHCVTGALYQDDPTGGFLLENVLIYFDIHLDNTTGVTQVIGRSCLFEPLADEIDVTIYYWDGTEWIKVSRQSFVDGCISFTITDSTFPNISQLGGLPFAAVASLLPEPIPMVNIPEKPFNEGDVSPTMTSGAHTFVRNVSVLQSQVAAGEPATVYANVVNTGDVAGGFTATLKVNGQVEKTENYVINGQAAQPVKYVIYRDQPGTYEVDLNGQKASFTVVGSAANNNPATNTQIILMVVIGAAILAAVLLVVLLRRRSTS